MSIFRCCNCGSSSVSRVLEESPCDDIDDWWCEGCDLLVDVKAISNTELDNIKKRFAQRQWYLKKFMEGCGYD